ncbi:MAG TPA: ATPase [Flavobacteriales bacterium]|jgi:hypothetical protein|nr:ATPase [Flavobacteriales bacterium]HHZ95052.1 ATPase [Flavobacteriales bacterium]HIB78203.1 ATPase [Flavobacteriales bacterium]HIO16431.1 ATPase [Flavobacteriales bacterium]HIO58961.1 ATPase [Flavobacteriales bacterium]
MNKVLYIALSLLISTSVFAQKKVDATFSVRGNCGMCEETIEAAYDVKGIVFADYDLEKEEMHVVYKTKHFNCIMCVQRLAANVGYDTRDIKANDDVYSKLADCCKYRSTKEKKTCSGNHEDHEDH